MAKTKKIEQEHTEEELLYVFYKWAAILSGAAIFVIGLIIGGIVGFRIGVGI